MDIQSWISAVATGVSAIAAVFTWKVSRNLYHLQKSIEDSKKATLHFWCNSNDNLTLLNVGKEAMPIRTLRVLEGYRSQTQRHVEITILKTAAVLNQMGTNCDSLLNGDTDLIFEPSVLYKIQLKQGQGQLTVEIMLYDGSFHFIEIDTSYLGGKYIFSGI